MVSWAVKVERSAGGTVSRITRAASWRGEGSLRRRRSVSWTISMSSKGWLGARSMIMNCHESTTIGSYMDILRIRNWFLTSSSVMVVVHCLLCGSSSVCEER
jgi:hypothetical protein